MKPWRRRLLIWNSCLCLLLVGALEFASFESLENRFRDWRFQARYHWAPATAPQNIVLVTIDDRALEEIKAPLSLWSSVYADALEKLVRAKAKVIAPDLLWQFDPASLSEAGVGSLELEKSLEEDELRAALAVGEGNIVVGAHRDGDRLNLPREVFVAMAADRLSLLNLNEESDGVIRRQFLSLPSRMGEEVQDFPSFSYKIAQVAVDLRATEVPSGEDDHFWINFRGPSGTFPKVSLAELLNTDDLSLFENKVVLLGPYDARLHDTRRSPFSSSGSPDMFGVEVHANAVATLLERDFLLPLNQGKEFLVSLVFATLIAVAFALASLLTAFLTASVLFAAWCLAALWAFCHYGLWLDISGKLVLVVGVSVGCYLVRYYQVERSRRLATALFGRYAPSQVVDQILDNPELAQLGGTSAEVTMLFCDIDGFSTISEKVEPEELIELINSFFGEMAKIIHRHGGVIRQFVGDEIMVIFGAPCPLENHAQAAIDTAVAAGLRLRALEKEAAGRLGFYRMKTGIHSGRVICGNVGSEERMEYTAVGDDVNLASRVMGLNKEFKSEILVTRETLELAGEAKAALKLREKGQHLVKGRERKVEIFEIVLEEE